MMHEDFHISSGRGELYLNLGHDCVYITISVLGAGYTMILKRGQIQRLIDALDALRRDIPAPD